MWFISLITLLRRKASHYLFCQLTEYLWELIQKVVLIYSPLLPDRQNPTQLFLTALLAISEWKETLWAQTNWISQCFLQTLALMWSHCCNLTQIQVMLVISQFTKGKLTCTHVWKHWQWPEQSPVWILALFSCCFGSRHWPSRGKSACATPELSVFKYTFTTYYCGVLG